MLALIMCKTHAFAQTADVYQKAADGYMDDKNYQQAVDNYTKAIKKNSYDKIQLSTLYYKRGQCFANLEKTDDALKDYNKAIELNPQSSDAYWGRGVIYDNDGKYQLSIADYKTAISLAKGNDINEGLAILYCNIANNEAALTNYTEALQADSISITLNEQYSRAYKVRGDIHGAQHNFTAAVDDLTKAIFSYKDDDAKGLSYIYTDRADAKRNLDKNKDAINDYSMAIKLNPDNGVAYWNRAATYHQNSDYELAADDYTKAMTFYKDDTKNLSELYDNRATNELGQTLYTKAISDDSVAIALDPANKEAYFTRANAYTQNADYQLGINDFNKLLTLYTGQNKALALLHFEVANNEYFLNEFDKVVDDCTKAIELDPGYSSSYYYRAKVYLKKLDKKDLAISDFNKVIALDTSKKTVNYIFSLFYTGKGDDAAAILQNNLLSTTDNAVMLADYYNLACLYSLMNKPDEANIYLKKAIDNGYAKKYAIADEDLDNIRKTDDYKSTIAGAPGQ